MKVNYNCWDKCFLCLTDLGSTSSSTCGGKKSRGSQKQAEINDQPNLSVLILIKYLLGNCDQNDSLLQRIRRLQLQQPNSPASSSEGLIKFCDKCQDSARRISHLQMELEVIQMKIVDILWSMRKTVIGNSNGHHGGTSGFPLEVFAEERQEILDTLHAFQAAVIEKSKKSVHVPLVYIEKFTGCNLKTILSNSAQEDKFLIKTEPEADSLEVILTDLGDDLDSFDYHEGVEVEEGIDTNNDVNITTPGHRRSAGVPLASPPPRKLQKRRIKPKKTKMKSKRGKEKSPGKRGRPRKNLEKVESSATSQPICPAFTDDLQPNDIKEEQAEFSSLSFTSEQDANPSIKVEDFADGTRKSRSAAQTAAKRIADVKKLSRASFQYRPRKVPNKARKNKETVTKSMPESSSSSHSQNPNKILLNPVLKTGKLMKITTPRNRGTNSKSRNRNRFYVCEICAYKTRKTFQFEHHLSQHESPEVVNHICPHCTNPPRQFSQKQSFDYHMDSHSGVNKMACDICTKYIDTIDILKHLRGHSNVEKIFQCSCCSYHCGTREAYLKHIRYHTTAALICDVCSKKFSTRKRMLEHMHDEHNLLEKIKCDVQNCDKEFFDTWLLQVHRKLHLEAFVCSECNLQFPTSGQLLGHQVREHSREKPVKCAKCPETFLARSYLQRHLINAHGADKFKCPHCPKDFASQGNLNSHINLHEGISFPCDKCDKAFGDRRQLKSHQVVHKTTKDFICEECGKAFRYADLLRSHMKIHIGDKKHKCSYCPKAFVDRQNLIVHERIHTGEKPYVCEACGKDFNQLGPLNQHMKTQHKELIVIKNKSEVTATGSTSTQEDELNMSLN